jgi:hypothetical protein
MMIATRKAPIAPRAPTLTIRRPYVRLKQISSRFIERLWVDLEPTPSRSPEEIYKHEIDRQKRRDDEGVYTVTISGNVIGHLPADLKPRVAEAVTSIVADGGYPASEHSCFHASAPAWIEALDREDVVILRGGRVQCIFRVGEDGRRFRIAPPIRRPRPRNSCPRWAKPGR